MRKMGERCGEAAKVTGSSPAIPTKAKAYTCGREVARKEKPRLILGFLYQVSRVDVQRVGNGE